ncbi:MAG: hypothetical protein ACLR2P_17105, partial [Bilophila wadsworthia]
PPPCSAAPPSGAVAASNAHSANMDSPHFMVILLFQGRLRVFPVCNHPMITRILPPNGGHPSEARLFSKESTL